MDNIGYDDTRYLNAHIGYRLRGSGGPYIQHLSQLPGYKDGIYKNSGNDVMVLNDSSTRPMRITVKDADGNSSDLVFEITEYSSRSKQSNCTG